MGPVSNAPNVFITVDTEFSAGGHFHDPDKRPVTDRSVYCEIDGRSHGLGFMLKTLKDTGLKATFFVEGAHTYVLGFENMRRPVQEIMEAGHDTQLHVHPMWLHRSPGRSGAGLTDSFGELTQQQMVDAIEQGLQSFSTWGAPPPAVFRPGGLHMHRSVYPILRGLGIPVSSSVGAGTITYDDAEIAIPSGRRWIDGVLEVPITSFCDFRIGPKRHYKILTVTGAGTGEILSVIDDAQRNGVEDVVLLTHTFEFIKRSSANYERIAPSRVTQARFRALCRKLASGSCSVRTVADAVPDWLQSGENVSADLMGSFPSAVSRMILNKANDLMWRL